MTFAIRLALCCVVAISSLGAAPPPEATHLLDRMRDAVGPVWSAHLTSTTRLTIQDTVETVSTDTLGTRLYTRRCDGELCTGTYFDGHRLFSVNINGTALPRTRANDRALTALRTVASFEFLASDWTEAGGRIEVESPTDVAGTQFDTVKIESNDIGSIELLVDPTSALVRFARDDASKSTFEFRDYTHVGALFVPSTISINGEPFENDANRAVSAEPFVAPGGLHVAFDGPDEALSTDPDYTMPIVDCTLERVVARCLIDSGDSGLSIGSAFAQKIGARTIGSSTVIGLGSFAAGVVAAGPLQIGNATFEPARYVVLQQAADDGYDVVLGADVLAATTIEVDPKNHLLRLRAQAPRRAITVPLSFDDFVPVVDVELGKVPASLAIDTGDESNINLSFDFYLAHRDLFRPRERRSVSGVGASSTELIGDIRGVTIGSYHGGAQMIGTTLSLRGTAFGHVGDAFLSNFRYFFNYASNELSIVPN